MTNSPTSGKIGTLSINMQTVTTYLIVAGTIFTCLLALLALVLLAYVAQLFLLSVGEVLHIFNTIDPLVRFFFILLIISVITIWCTRKRR